MPRLAPVFLSAALLASPALALTQGGPPDGSTPEEQAVIANDPPFHPRTLTLSGAPQGRAKRLFNGRDPAIPYPFRRYMPGGPLLPIQMPAFNVDANRNAEWPQGQWNTLDIYTLGDRSIHVVNGVPVMAASGFTTTDARGKVHPLVRGRIQLQSEGAETWLHDITITPITRLPRIVVRKDDN